ncbi:MAG: thioether cross-link-forming SCIFF peptide maturase [Oscillospiraceae bacterium]|jgi:uncharacterized protein|nr:thioether cross-link-forming SCIFF peptide maturase [Oscillospiraceae bacterium]
MIHAYKLMGQNIIIDAGSGCVHAIDDAAYDAIALYETCGRDELAARLTAEYPELTRDDLDELFADIEELKKDGKLFAPDAALEADGRSGGKRDIKALCLHVAHTCNLTCDYCFAGQGRYHGDAALMSAATARRAIDFLVENSGDKRNLEVDFFGGEPLLAWDTVVETVKYARSLESEHGKNFRFTLTTNGVLLDDEVTEFCNAEISNVVLSLDGRREIHDARRKTPQGGGSYDAIVPKFRRFAEKREGGYYMRGTYTSANLDFTEDILHIADLGFTELAMEPAVSAPGDALGLTAADLPELFRQYEILAAEMVRREGEGKPFAFYHYTLDLENGPCVYKRVAGCGSGSEYFAVTPEGELYPCHQLVGEREFVAGDIWGGVKDGFEFRRKVINEREECRGCWAKLYCSGGCAANAYHASGDADGVYELGCELFKKRLECAIWMKVI